MLCLFTFLFIYFIIICHFNDWLIIGKLLLPIYYYRLIEPVCIVIMTNGFFEIRNFG